MHSNSADDDDSKMACTAWHHQATAMPFHVLITYFLGGLGISGDMLPSCQIAGPQINYYQAWHTHLSMDLYILEPFPSMRHLP
jgi:hypothetical protein